MLFLVARQQSARQARNWVPVCRAVPCRAEQNRSEFCHTAGAMTSPVFTGCQETSRHLVRHNSGNSAYGSSPRNRQRNNAITVARTSLAQLGYISEAVSSLQFSSVPGVTVKKSVFKEQLYERVVKKES
jgi:hypothetical protein